VDEAAAFAGKRIPSPHHSKRATPHRPLKKSLIFRPNVFSDEPVERFRVVLLRLAVLPVFGAKSPQ
jgi:hypothetical protein